MNAVDVAWAVGRPTLGSLARLAAPLRVYGRENVPPTGGLVLALNHFSWLDPATFGVACPRNIRYMAKIEAHSVPGLGQLIRLFGTFSVRRGESDREAVRMMRQIVRDGHALGLFVEGTRQRSGVPGEVKPGAAMVAVQEGVPVVFGVVHGTQHWRVGNFHPVSVAWGAPQSYGDMARNAKGYREASAAIQDEIRRLWDWLVDVHAAGRPRGLTPPSAGSAALRPSERRQRP